MSEAIVSTSGVSFPDETLQIVMAFDDGYWAPTYAAMRSICLTSPTPRQLCFHLLHRPLTEEHRASIESIGTEYGASINFINLDDYDVLTSKIEKFPRVTARRLNIIVYARLFLGELLDPAIQRVLYLDSDIFVRSDLAPLYFMDMQGQAIAAALQPDRIHCIAGRDLRARNAFSMAEPYFNAGVMLIDMAQYRAMDFGAVLREGLPESELAMFYYDQDIINFCFRRRFLEIDMRWNLQNPETAHEILNPAILHYSADNKPWLLWSDVAFKRTYRHMMTNAHFNKYRGERVAKTLRKLFRLPQAS